MALMSITRKEHPEQQKDTTPIAFVNGPLHLIDVLLHLLFTMFATQKLLILLIQH